MLARTCKKFNKRAPNGCPYKMSAIPSETCDRSCALPKIHPHCCTERILATNRAVPYGLSTIALVGNELPVGAPHKIYPYCYTERILATNRAVPYSLSTIALVGNELPVGAPPQKRKTAPGIPRTVINGASFPLPHLLAGLRKTFPGFFDIRLFHSAAIQKNNFRV